LWDVSSDRELLARIAAGPRFLLLGQGTKRLTLAEASRDSGWFFPGELAPDQATKVPHIRSEDLRAYEAFVADATCPAELKAVTSIPWNGVLTSRIDGAISRWFETDWRRVVPVAAQAGRGSRSTTELQVRYLFGGLELPEDERPPDSELAWIDSQRNASDALSALAANLITPKGVLLADGWSLLDWLSPTDIYNVASRLAPGQVHLFSVDEDVASNSLIAAGVSRGVITAHPETLNDILSEAASSGLLAEPTGETVDRTRLIPAGSGFVRIDVATWNRIVGTARPVDFELLEPFPYASGPLAYQRFRTFLGSPEGAPPWRAVASGMKLARTYEPKLVKLVEAALEDPEDVGPIVLQGQTATGKSLALVWLAQVLAKSGKAAVLHQSRRRDRPVASEVESYSLWAEDVAGLKTVLIWDGMVDADDYFALHRQLRARGQRVLIVGSTYLSAGEAHWVVTAPIHLDSQEAEAIGPWLGSYGIELPPAAAGADTSFLALLYRALPETEAGLRRGLALEMRAAESGLEALSRERRQHEPESRMTAIAEALIAAGLDIETLAPAEHSPEELPGLAFAERSTTEQLSAMLLTAGRRGLNVPLELALRLVGREGSSAIVDFIRHFDIFRWTEEANGGQFLGVRTRLEAELLAREDLTDMTEIQVATSFIQNVKPDFYGRSGGDELQFIVDLMDQIGPQSEEQGRYARWYGELADAFRDQREQTGLVHPRLVLLEVNLSREFVKRAQHTNALSRDERLAQLRDSEQLLLRTLEEADSSPRSRLNLYVELAASLGSQVHELVSEPGPESQDAVSPLLERLVDAVMRAREADPENIYPVDVLVWSAKDAVGSGSLTTESKLNLLADAQASLDSLDPQDLSPKQQAKYRSRQAEIASLLGDKELETNYLQELMAMDNPAAYYLLASRAAKTTDPEGVNVALDTLLSAPLSIRDDWKCARLILDLFWLQGTGDRLLRGERNTVPFAESDWHACLDLVDTLHGAAGFDQYRISFVRGLALFHLGSISASQAEYRRLGSLGLDVGRRVYLAYLASNPGGTPREFTGRVAWATPDGRRGRIWVDQIKAEIDFVPLRFSPEAFRNKNEVVPTFHIGFNYRGPIADPIRRRARPPANRPA
jgi:hypothetical protein